MIFKKTAAFRNLILAALLCCVSSAKAWDPNKPFIYEMKIAFETDNWVNAYSTSTILSKSDNTVAFRVVANSTTNPTYQLVVTTQGNVGIGTASPGYALELSTGQGRLAAIHAPNAGLFIYGDDDSATFTGSLNTVTLNASRYDGGVLPKLRLAGQGGIELASDANSVRAVIDDNGNVGIGTTSPLAKVHIASSQTGPGVVAIPMLLFTANAVPGLLDKNRISAYNVSLADDETSAVIAYHGAVLVMAFNTSDNTAALAFYGGSGISLVADPDGAYAISDTDGKNCFMIYGNQVLFKNRTGSAKAYSFMVFSMFWY